MFGCFQTLKEGFQQQKITKKQRLALICLNTGFEKNHDDE
jgi:hypothetical protein